MIYHHHHIKFLTLSPLHIGNGNSLTSVGEYITAGSKVKIINQDSLYQTLEENKLTKDYIDLITSKGANTNIWKFFSENEIEKNLKYIKEISFNATGFNPENNNLMELAAKSGNNLYVAGSSIKGALRAILFFFHISNDRVLQKRIEDVILSKTDLWKISSEISKIEQDLFNEDFKNLRIEDSQDIPIEDTIIELSKRHNLFEDVPGNLDNMRECIAEKTSFYSRITIVPQIAQSMISFLNEEHLTGFFDAINEVSLRNIDFEIELLRKSKDKVAKDLILDLSALKTKFQNATGKIALIRLGKGKAYFFQTLAAFVSDKAQEKLLRLMYKPDDNQISFPKTRVLTANNKMFGWVELRVQETEIYNSDELPKAELVNNIIEKIEAQKTKITVFCTDDKQVEFLLNGKTYKNIQLVKAFEIKHVDIEKNRKLTATIWQISKNGNINQVKIFEI
jgi:CRISPR type III-A-associated RAMP protein Csm5